ncbi:hypothetical protein CANARDRAFT_5395 [[Candida] arabinofermentans NRRL YB-2248]|uniref:Zn(2)-C6 fungal-type domain-containing protein n=1 Tax=[Candida] arabinofermentans NRRL YB-2248 TaxID=983967 RepID=A0A1E4T8N0_9ASCO|nr:hypothetical protein CANARDRAFT_5395 [[Candida] arabinofermentans NRRL YB-2248]
MPRSLSPSQGSATPSSIQTPHRTKSALPNVHPTNSLILESGKVYKIQKVRQRKILSCIPCHQRKIKCAREKPVCLNCERLASKNPVKQGEIIKACQYFVNDKKKNLKKNGAMDVIELTSKPVDPSRVVGRRPITVTESGNQHQKPQQNQQQQQQQQQQQHQEDESTEESELENDVQIPKVEEPVIYNMEHEDPHEKTTELQIDDYDQLDRQYDTKSGNLNEDEEDYDNTSDEDYVLNRLVSEKQSAENSEIQSEQQQAQHDKLMQDIKYYTDEYMKNLELVINNMPSKDRSDELLNNYKRSIHSVLPIIDMETFQKKYDEFWYCGLFLQHNMEKLFQYHFYYKDALSCPNEITDFLYWYNRTTCLLNPNNMHEFCMLLFVMFYSSAASETYQFPSSQTGLLKNEIIKYFQVFNASNSRSLNNPKTISLGTLQINILLQSVTNLKNGKSLINIVKILRICQFYQLNRDPVVFHNLKDHRTVQARRIVWWQIFRLDNLVSFFLNLSPIIKLDEFDTALPMENSFDRANSLDISSSNYSICYLNSNFRFSLVVNELAKQSNGLNLQLKNEDISNLVSKISDLYISCCSSRICLEKVADSLRIGSKKGIHSVNDVTVENHLNLIKYCNLMTSILSDKALIMLQKKILIIPYSMASTSFPNCNLNFVLLPNRPTYHYTDLSYNLLPALLHYISVFIELSDPSMIKFNWQLKNFIPIDELILLITILVTNLKNGSDQFTMQPIGDSTATQDDGYFNVDINLKIHLIDTTIQVFKNNWQGKLSSINKLVSLVSDIWLLIKLKFKLDLNVIESYRDTLPNRSFVLPQPYHADVNVGDSPGNDSSTLAPQSSTQKIEQQNGHQKQEVQSRKPQDSILTESDQMNEQQYTSVSCAEVAPRTIRLATSSVASFSQPFYSDIPQSTKTNFAKPNHEQQQHRSNIIDSYEKSSTKNSVLTTPLCEPSELTTYSSITLDTGEVTSLRTGDNSGDSYERTSSASSVNYEKQRQNQSQSQLQHENVDLIVKQLVDRLETMLDDDNSSIIKLASSSKQTTDSNHNDNNNNGNDEFFQQKSNLKSSTIPNHQSSILIDPLEDEEHDEGWLALGTGNFYGCSILNDDDNDVFQRVEDNGINADVDLQTNAAFVIDDFHFYKGLKNDVVNLFRIIIT